MQTETVKLVNRTLQHTTVKATHFDCHDHKIGEQETSQATYGYHKADGHPNQ